MFCGNPHGVWPFRGVVPCAGVGMVFTVFLNTFSLADILVMVGGAIPPAPVVPASQY